ncbi:MAG: 4Fe-4S binding protein [Methanomicrobiales archaeon]|nr:4Fe-4S binding protein [Methanomicrobiales archaeon]
MAAVVNEERCAGCETCVDICPSRSISMNDGKENIDQKSCVECSACLNACPSSAITME